MEAGHVVAAAEFVIQRRENRLSEAAPAFGAVKPLKVYMEENRFLCARNNVIDVRFDKAFGRMTRLPKYVLKAVTAKKEG